MSKRKQFRDLASPSALASAIEAFDLAPPTETVDLLEADGRVVAERIDAGIDVPGFDRSTKDGYAVRAADTFEATENDPFQATVLETVEAGEAPSERVTEGTAVEVATGGVVSPGADAVVPVERTSRIEDGRVSIRTAIAPGDNVMHSGDDVAAGDRAIGPGTVLTTRDVGLLAALGVDSVPVRGKPVVGIVSTGDELVRPGEPRDDDRGQIYDLNTYALAAAVRSAGGEPEVVEHIGDDYEKMHRTLEAVGDRCDLVLSSGSTSASDADVLYQVVADHGSLDLHGVAVKPGRPTIVGEIADAPYIGLPGNPVSALSVFRRFVAPAVRAAAGRPAASAPTVDGEMAAGVRYSEGRTYLLPVAIIEDAAGDVLVYPVDKGSGAITSLTEADGIVEIPPETERLPPGQAVTVDLFSTETRAPTVLGIGEADPLLARVLDHVDGPRYLSHGSAEGRRRLRDGVPDFAVVTEADAAVVEGDRLGAFSREWGLVVPAGNPAAIEGLADLTDVESFVNVASGMGLRAVFDDALAAHAEETGQSLDAVTDGIAGYERTVKGIRSPAQRVANGTADAGLGLHAAVQSQDVTFVPVGTQRLVILGAPARQGKAGLTRFESVLSDTGTEVATEMVGYDFEPLR